MAEIYAQLHSHNKNASTISIEIQPHKIIITHQHGYKLVIEIEKDKIIATYADVTLIITNSDSKLDIAKIAKKIHTIVRQSHHFSISIISDALERWAKKYYIEGLADNIIKKLEKLKKEGKLDYEKLRKINELLGD
ncbi:E135 [Sulfolobus spindle-shaped virus Lassen]|nr:E135 [Sulfolobus spindle-shaped virus Lassen]